MTNDLIISKKYIWVIRKILSILAWATTAVVMIYLLPYSIFSYIVCIIYVLRIFAEIVYIKVED
jgi:hypothetical protein